MRWCDLERQQPRLAALGRMRLFDPGVVLVGTIRRDGTPRISPVEPLLWDGDLWFSMIEGSLKARDLERDPRVLVHGIVTERDGDAGEYKVRGEAMAENSREQHRAYAEEIVKHVDWTPEPGRFHLFRIEIDDVTFIRYDEATGDQFVARWPGDEEFVRRGTTATSLGAREPRREFLRS